MKALILLILLLCGATQHVVYASEVEKLVETLKKVAKPDAGIPSEGQEVAQKLQAIGPEAIPYLLPLLRSENHDVSTLASYVLRDMEGLTESDLDALIEFQRKDNGWIPPAIARIGSPRAISFLVEELVRDRETQTQLTYAIEILGEKAVPRLVEVFQNEKGWDDRLEMTMYSVFKELGAKAVTAIDPLLKIASDETILAKKRIHALMAIGAIGLSAERAVPVLQKLQEHKDESIKEAASSAILNIGSAEAAPIFSRMLEQAPDHRDQTLLLRDIAALRAHGKAAGAAVAKRLSDENWDVRVQAARALGYIGYEDATDALIALLKRKDDWRLVLSAAESLGRLKSERALPALSVVSKYHWFPPVREAALTAAKIIRGEPIPKAEDSGNNFASDFFEYEHAGARMEWLAEDDARLIRFPLAAAPDKDVENAIRKFRHRGTGGPMCGVKVKDGYLIGADEGEFGGELSFFDSKGKSRHIISENTEAIYKTERGIFAVTGLAHISMNSGFVFEVSTSTDGSWTAAKWRALPGAPRFSRLLKDGNILVSCHGGIVLVSPDGDMKLLSRRESLRPVSGP